MVSEERAANTASMNTQSSSRLPLVASVSCRNKWRTKPIVCIVTKMPMPGASNN